MAVSVNPYNSYKDDLLKGTIDLTQDTIKVALCTSSYTPSATHDFFDDITNQVSATGYTAGGATVGSPTVTGGVFDAADVAWTSSTITARYGIIYKSTGTAGTSPLIAYIDFDADKVSDNGTFTIAWNASGIFSVSFA